jgi:WD40 repeat protein/serine/threonine protein kinase
VSPTAKPNRAKEVFDQAFELPRDERAAFVQRACGADAILRARVEALLQADDEAESFLPDAPATGHTVLVTEKPGDVIGRYKLLQKIGEGGCGVVYMAEQAEPVRRRVALKIIKLGMDTRRVVARFEAERQALAMMDHPNIAKVFDGGATETGRPFFVMELVRGVRITDYCDEHRLDTRARLELFIRVAQAIQHAHQKGVIHRDIKPSNILVTVNDGVPMPKVIDFGTAKAIEQRLTDKTLFTEFQSFIGTPAYMSPEQAEMSSLDIDTRSDIYALGVLLYELLTGRTPFDPHELTRGGLDAMRRAIREREPLSPSSTLGQFTPAEITSTAERRRADAPQLISALRGDLDWIVMKCLEKDRTRRYDTATGLAHDLQRYLNNEPVSACPPSVWYRARKAIRRNRVAFAASAIVVLALATGFGLTTWMFLRERAAQREQSRQRTVAEVESARARESAAKLRQQAYAADMKLAHVAFTENNIGQTAQLLERWQPRDGEEDLRGFEWRYLRQLSQSTARQVFNLGLPLNAAALSPDGRLLAVNGVDARVRIIETATGNVLTNFTGPPENNGVAWSPDGGRLAVGELGRFVIRDAFDWRVAREFRFGVNYVAWSPDGRTIAAVESSGSLYLIDAESGVATWISKGLKGRVRVAFSADGQQVGAAHWAGVEIWNVNSRERRHSFHELGTPAGLAFSPDGLFAASGSSGGRVAVWNLRDGRLLLATNAHTAPVFGVAFSPDGRWLVSGGGDQVLRVWNAPTESSRVLRLAGTWRGHANEVWCVDFSRDGKWLITSGKDGSARLWDAAPQTDPAAVVSIKCGAGMPLGFTPDSRLWRSMRRDGSAVDEWSLMDGHLARSLPLPPNFAGAGASDQSALVFAEGTAWLLDGRNVLQEWDLPATNKLRSFVAGTNGIVPMAISHDGNHLLVRDSNPPYLLLWNTRTGQQEAQLGYLPTVGPWSYALAAFSSDDRWLAFPAGNHLVKIWDVKARREKHSFAGHNWFLNAVTFSPDGKRVGSAGWEGIIRVWNVESGTAALPPLLGHLAAVRALNFTKDGRTLLAADDQGTVRAWHMATGQEMLTLPGHWPSPSGMLSPDNRLLLLDAPDADGEVRALRVPDLE